MKRWLMCRYYFVQNLLADVIVIRYTKKFQISTGSVEKAWQDIAAYFFLYKLEMIRHHREKCVWLFGFEVGLWLVVAVWFGATYLKLSASFPLLYNENY